MIAIETINEEGKPEILLSPGQLKIKNSTTGYFVFFGLLNYIAQAFYNQITIYNQNRGKNHVT